MPRKNRRENKDKMGKATKFADVHNCDSDLFKEIDDEKEEDDKDWLNKNY